MVQRGWVAHRVWTGPPAAVAACCSIFLADAHSHPSSCSWLVGDYRLQTYMMTNSMIGLQTTPVEFPDVHTQGIQPTQGVGHPEGCS